MKYISLCILTLLFSSCSAEVNYIDRENIKYISIIKEGPQGAIITLSEKESFNKWLKRMVKIKAVASYPKNGKLLIQYKKKNKEYDIGIMNNYVVIYIKNDVYIIRGKPFESWK